MAVPAQDPEPKDAIKRLLADHVAPFLKKAGFTKAGTTFHRSRGDLIDVVNFQGSQWNGWGTSKWYVNCCMDSVDIQKVRVGLADRKPKYYACTYNRRIAEVVGGEPHIALAEDGRVVDLEALGGQVVTDLGRVLAFFDTVSSTSELMDVLVAGNFLAGYEKISAYLAQRDDVARLTKYIATLHGRFSGSDTRWPFFADRIHHEIGPYAEDPHIAGMLEGHDSSVLRRRPAQQS